MAILSTARCPICGFEFWAIINLVQCRQCKHIFKLEKEDSDSGDNHIGKSFKNA
jgi:rubredoxin